MTAMNAPELMGPSWECPEQQPNDPGFIDLTGGSDMDQTFGGYDPHGPGMSGGFSRPAPGTPGPSRPAPGTPGPSRFGPAAGTPTPYIAGDSTPAPGTPVPNAGMPAPNTPSRSRSTVPKPSKAPPRMGIGEPSSSATVPARDRSRSPWRGGWYADRVPQYPSGVKVPRPPRPPPPPQRMREGTNTPPFLPGPPKARPKATAVKSTPTGPQGPSLPKGTGPPPVPAVLDRQP